MELTNPLRPFNFWRQYERLVLPHVSDQGLRLHHQCLLKILFTCGILVSIFVRFKCDLRVRFSVQLNALALKETLINYFAVTNLFNYLRLNFLPQKLYLPAELKFAYSATL